MLKKVNFDYYNMWSLKSDMDMATQCMERGCEKAEGGSPLMRAQMYTHLLRFLEANDKMASKFVSDDVIIVTSKCDTYAQYIRDIYGEHSGVSF